ncbi:MAG: hypothetical protein L0Z62_38640 [Gemmataceae bacterium]|nr:hypothetical protein [Gemmataceae bacterium]
MPSPDVSSTPVTAVCSPDGRLCATGDQTGTLTISRLPLGVPRHIVAPHTARLTPHVHCRTGHARPIRQLAFPPDGLRLLSASDDGGLWCWDVESGEPVARVALDSPAQTTPPGFLAVSADGKRVALMDGSGEVGVWAPNHNFAEVCRFTDRPGSPSGLALSVDGGLLARACSGRIDILDLAREALLHRLPGHEGPDTLLQFMPRPVARRPAPARSR